MWYWSFSPLIFILLLSKTQHSFASQKPRRFYHRSAKSVELQRGNYTAHISLLLILKAWSILQNTEFLPCILWGLSASVLILLQLCPVAAFVLHCPSERMGSLIQSWDWGWWFVQVNSYPTHGTQGAPSWATPLGRAEAPSVFCCAAPQEMVDGEGCKSSNKSCGQLCGSAEQHQRAQGTWYFPP